EAGVDPPRAASPRTDTDVRSSVLVAVADRAQGIAEAVGIAVAGELEQHRAGRSRERARESPVIQSAGSGDQYVRGTVEVDVAHSADFQADDVGPVPAVDRAQQGPTRAGAQFDHAAAMSSDERPSEGIGDRVVPNGVAVDVAKRRHAKQTAAWPD